MKTADFISEDALKLEHFAEIREKLWELCALDIADSDPHTSSRNYVFLFDKGIRPSIIRLSLTDERTRADILSELIWVEYLREHVHTICQPIPFKTNTLVEEFSIEGKHYYSSMFRKANGNTPDSSELDLRQFQLIGKKLGELHKASFTGSSEGFHYKRPDFSVRCPLHFDGPEARAYLDLDVIDTIKATLAFMAQIEKTPTCFGMVHGDFHMGNLFLDWDDVWVYDFDDCHDNFFVYDIAWSLANLYFMCAGSDPQQFAPIRAAFQAGYETEYQLPDFFWQNDTLNHFALSRFAEAFLVTLSVHSPTQMKTVLPRLIHILRGLTSGAIVVF